MRSGKLSLEWERIDLCELARETVRRMAPHFLEAGARAPRVHSEGAVHGVWDRMRLEQVLTNLLTNALRYGKSGPVDVVVGVEGTMVRMSVSNGGVGIGEEAKKRIFERFERAVDANEVSGLGLGLGLYIVRQFVEAHGGRAYVESELGMGSTFSVELPIEPEDWSGRAPPESANRGPAPVT